MKRAFSNIRSENVAKSKKKGTDLKTSAPGVSAQKMTRKEFEKELYKLQVELTRLGVGCR